MQEILKRFKEADDADEKTDTFEDILNQLENLAESSQLADAVNELATIYLVSSMSFILYGFIETCFFLNPSCQSLHCIKYMRIMFSLNLVWQFFHLAKV